MAKVKVSKAVPQAAKKIDASLRTLKVVSTVTRIDNTINIQVPYCDDKHATSVLSIAGAEAQKHRLTIEHKRTQTGLSVSLAA